MLREGALNPVLPVAVSEAVPGTDSVEKLLAPEAFIARFRQGGELDGLTVLEDKRTDGGVHPLGCLLVGDA